MRRLIAALTLVTLAVSITIISACIERTGFGVTLTILGEDSSNLQAMQSLKDPYEKENKVRIEFKPNTFEDALRKANEDFVNQTGLYDVVLQYNFSLSSFVRNDYVHLLNDLKTKFATQPLSFEDDIFPQVWKEVGYYHKDPTQPGDEMEPVAYPFAANTMLLVYNKALFEDPANKAEYKRLFNKELKVPEDWDQFEQVAKYFTKRDKGLDGVALQGATGGWLYYEWASFLQSFGGKVMNKDFGWQGESSTAINVASPQAIEATNFLKRLKPYTAGTYTTVDANEQRRLMQEGKAAMAIMWSDYLFDLTDNGKQSKFGFAPTPGSHSIIAGGSFYINRKSKNPGEAFKYVSYLLEKDTQVALMKKGLCSPLMSVYSDPEVQKIPYANALKTSLERATYAIEAGPDAELINQKITTYMQKFWNDEMSAETALRSAQKEIVEERKQIFKEIK